jgi:hypothetical protein
MGLPMPPRPRKASVPAVLSGEGFASLFRSAGASAGGMLERPRRVIAPCGRGGGGGRKVLFLFELLNVGLRVEPNLPTNGKATGKRRQTPPNADQRLNLQQT